MKIERNKNKDKLMISIQQEFENMLDLLADFHNGLETSQRQRFRELLTANYHCYQRSDVE